MPRKAVVIGLDGLEPAIVDRMLERGELPNLARLRESGGYSRVATTWPAQTPVAWSTFVTGVNPGGHGIYDFLRRDPKTYFPDLGLNRYEQKSAFLPPKVVNLRRGTPLWDVLGAAGIPATVVRCPCTYPPDALKGRLLAGMGVPDIRGGLGTSTFYTTAAAVTARESEHVLKLQERGSKGEYVSNVIGPRNPKAKDDMRAAVTFELDAAARTVTVRSEGEPRVLVLRLGAWSDWLRLKFRAGLLQSVSGVVRFLLVRLTPEIEIYASPVNFDPAAPLFPIAHPWEYSGELARQLGTFYTSGMVEDHTGLSNERYSEEAFLAQCDDVLREREAMLHFELDRLREGFAFCLFDTPDRVQHMFWRFGEDAHPANRESAERRLAMARVIEEHYRTCDAIVGRVLERVASDTLLIVLSDHGFTSFQRGVHLNAWLRQQGYLTLKPGIDPAEDAGSGEGAGAGAGAGEFFKHVDWTRTRAYALGIGSLYLNVRSREAEGIVQPDEVDGLSREIADRLTGMVDAARGALAVRSVKCKREIYSGPYIDEAPDLVVGFAAGYRASWTTALGGVPGQLVEDNVKKWGGDHIVDPALVPGVLFMNRRFDAAQPRLVDMAPTILSALGAPTPGVMEGRPLLGA
ncbi:MAG: alkaline phosphatase family protein [Gemmatimonadaceae bacterium]